MNKPEYTVVLNNTYDYRSCVEFLEEKYPQEFNRDRLWKAIRKHNCLDYNVVFVYWPEEEEVSSKEELLLFKEFWLTDEDTIELADKSDDEIKQILTEHAADLRFWVEL